MQGPKRLLLAAAGGTLAWLADQPAVDGYVPFAALFGTSRFWSGPSIDHAVMLLAWFLGALGCHFLLFAFQRLRAR